MRVNIEEKFFVSEHFGAPRGAVESLQLFKFFAGEIQTLPIDIFITRHPANGGFFGSATPAHAIEDPFQHTHIFTKARPRKITGFILTEPVHVENARGLREIALHINPMPEIIAHVVPAEGQHRHRIATHFANRTRRCGRHLGTHSCANINPAAPVKRLINERHRGRAPTAKNKGTDRHAGGTLPVGVHRRTLRRGRSEARVRVRCLDPFLLG